MHCISNLVAALALGATAAATPAQGPLAVGTHDVVWANKSGFGTPDLAARVCYPSPIGGVDTEILPSPTGWPVIVFLHGYSLLGRDYAALGEAWASEGFAVIQLDTAQFDWQAQAQDGRAVFAALLAANADPDEFVNGAFDTGRIAIAGHSMGGGTMGLILANNPGYRCGFALAPVSPAVTAAAQVTVPFGLAVGTGDAITPPFVFSQPYYDAVAPTSGLKFWHLMDQTCTHMNLVGFPPQGRVFARTNAIVVGFFRHFLDVDPTGIDRCIGPAANTEVTLVSLAVSVAQPRIWTSAPLSIGNLVRVSIAAEQGLGGILAGPAVTAGMPTSLGMLMLDPASAFTWVSGVAERQRRIDAWLNVPNDVGLIGVSVAFQSIGASTSSTLQLGSAAEFVIMP